MDSQADAFNPYSAPRVHAWTRTVAPGERLSVTFEITPDDLKKVQRLVASRIGGLLVMAILLSPLAISAGFLGLGFGPAWAVAVVPLVPVILIIIVGTFLSRQKRSRVEEAPPGPMTIEVDPKGLVTRLPGFVEARRTWNAVESIELKEGYIIIRYRVYHHVRLCYVVRADVDMIPPHALTPEGSEEFLQAAKRYAAEAARTASGELPS